MSSVLLNYEFDADDVPHLLANLRSTRSGQLRGEMMIGKLAAPQPYQTIDCFDWEHPRFHLHLASRVQLDRLIAALDDFRDQWEATETDGQVQAVAAD
jgi:hypothetical protein